MSIHVVFGHGQVGRELVRELSLRGRSVRVITRSRPHDLARGVEHVAGDARDAAFTARACAGASVVYAVVNAPYHRWPTELPPLQAGILAGAQRAGAKLVVLENLYMLGPVDGPMREDLPHRPIEAKGEVRARMSEALLDAHRAGRVQVAIGRASDFFGPGVETSQLGLDLFRAVVRGRTARVLGDPDQPHSYAFVPDVARGLAILGEHETALGRVWHLPHVRATTSREILGHAAALAGARAKVSRAPRWLMAALALFVPPLRELLAISYQVERPFVVDDRAFTEAFGVAATPFDEAVRATVLAVHPAAPRAFAGPSTSIRIVESAADTRGARLRFEQTIAVGAASPPRHVHGEQSETFTVRSGRLGLEQDGARVVLGPGESLRVPAGAGHTFWNAGDVPCVHEVLLEPARDMEHFFEGIVTLEAQHRLPPHGPPDLARIALLFARHENYVAGVPRALQRVAFALVRGLADLASIEPPRYEEVRAESSGTE